MVILGLMMDKQTQARTILLLLPRLVLRRSKAMTLLTSGTLFLAQGIRRITSNLIKSATSNTDLIRYFNEWCKTPKPETRCLAYLDRHIRYDFEGIPVTFIDKPTADDNIYIGLALLYSMPSHQKIHNPRMKMLTFLSAIRIFKNVKPFYRSSSNKHFGVN